MNESKIATLEPRHDFVAKLKGEKLLPAVRRYVEWQRDVRMKRAKGEPDPPLPQGFVPPAIQLDLTTACNSQCPSCIDREILNRKEAHNYASLIGSLLNMANQGLRSVIFIGGGEPTIHPDFRGTLHFLKDRGIQVGVVSNGLYWEPIVDVADRLVRPDWVRISLDAGSNPTFQALREPRNRMNLDDVCIVASAVHRRNPDLPIGYSFVISWPNTVTEHNEPIAENIHEIVMAAERAKEWGFSYISFKAFLTRAMTGSEVIEPGTAENLEAAKERIRENIAEAKKLEEPGFEVSVSKNLRVILDGTWKRLTDQPRVCHKQALQLVVTPLGTFNCPSYRGVEKARVTGASPWAPGSERRTGAALANVLDRFDAHAECANTVCFYNDMNWYLEDLIEGGETLPIEGIPGVDCFL